MSGAGESSNPDLEAGIPDQTLSDGAMLIGHVGEDAVLLARRGAELLRSVPPALIMVGRSAKGCWSKTRCDARGTMPASACVPEKHLRRRP